MKGLEDTDGSTYFNDVKSQYAVTGARYAGGYIGYMDIGSAASVGKGLSILGKILLLMRQKMMFLEMPVDLPERFPVDTFRTPTQITFLISLVRLQPVVM